MADPYVYVDASTKVLAAMNRVVDDILAREKPTRIVIAYSGHGSPNVFFQDALTMQDGERFLQHVREKAPGVPIVLDFSTNCNTAYFDFIEHYWNRADYLVASEKPVGGFAPADFDAWLKVGHDYNYHRFFSTDNPTVAALDMMVAYRQAVWATGAASLKANVNEQSLAVFNLRQFDPLMQALLKAPHRAPFTALGSNADIGSYIYRSGDADLIARFERFRFRYVSDRDIVTWSDDARGFSLWDTYDRDAYLTAHP